MDKLPRGRPPLPEKFKVGKLLKPTIRIPHEMAIALRMFYGDHEVRTKFLEWTRAGVNLQGDIHPQLRLSLMKWLDEAIALERHREKEQTKD